MSNQQMTFDDVYDAIIVGARCAGASTAMLLARAGAKVLLVDRQDYGSDRTSTPGAAISTYDPKLEKTALRSSGSVAATATTSG